MRKAPSKATQERIERMLNDLFKLPGNDQCADCKQKNPRWASYSLGIFLCIRCASLHRKMGTHISKVKSVSMDRWTAEEVQFMKKLGGNNQVNNRVNPSPALHPLPLALDDDHAMEIYIRKKWQRRAFEEQVVEEEEEEERLSCPTPEIPSASSTTSSLVSSPTIQQQLAGQAFPINRNNSNPFLLLEKNEQTQQSYSPTLINNVNPFNNPFQDRRMTMNPFYQNTETTSNNDQHSRSNSYNPFLM